MFSIHVLPLPHNHFENANSVEEKEKKEKKVKGNNKKTLHRFETGMYEDLPTPETIFVIGIQTALDVK